MPLTLRSPVVFLVSKDRILLLTEASDEQQIFRCVLTEQNHVDTKFHLGELT